MRAATARPPLRPGRHVVQPGQAAAGARSDIAGPLPTPLAAMELPPHLKQHLKPVDYKGDARLKGRVYEIADWRKWTTPQRIKFIRDFIEDKARDPHIAEFAVGILKAAGVPPRDSERAWAALLRWVQTNIYYVNEPNERLQSPQYTLTVKMGDCDDLFILLCALGHSLRLPWRAVLSGRTTTGRLVRWIENPNAPDPTTVWAHIYALVGWPAFKPTEWRYAEPTMRVPLGWDVVQAREKGWRGEGLRELGSIVAPTPPPVTAPLPVAARPPDPEPSAKLPATTPKAPKGLSTLFKAISWGAVLTGVVTIVLGAVATRRFAARTNPRRNARKRNHCGGCARTAA